MLRRDFVRGVVSVSIAPRLLLSQQAASPSPPPPAPVPWTLGLNPATPLPHTEVVEGIAEGDLEFFAPRQMATLARLCQVMMPPVGDKPGALQAQTPMFLDFLIGSSPETRKKLYTGGLNWLDAESQKKHTLPFAELSDEQADATLKPWLRTWMSDHPPTEMHTDFVNIVHDDIRTATVNSKAWSEAPPAGPHEREDVGLYWSPIEPDIVGQKSERMRVPPHVRATPKSAHPIPSYPR